MSKSIEAIAAIKRSVEQAEEYNARNPDQQVNWFACDLDQINHLLAALSRASEVEAQTIERCAKECEEVAKGYDNEWNVGLGLAADLVDVAEDCAERIRSMRPTGDSGVQS